VPLLSSGGIFCFSVVKYLEIFQKDDVWGCSELRKKFHFVFFTCWILVRKIRVKRVDKKRVVGVRSLWKRRWK
jgi:hypothetical protein